MLSFYDSNILEAYRSGHNENDSKSFWRDERHVGSNPTVSAIPGKSLIFRGLLLLNRDGRSGSALRKFSALLRI